MSLFITMLERSAPNFFDLFLGLRGLWTDAMRSTNAGWGQGRARAWEMLVCCLLGYGAPQCLVLHKSCAGLQWFVFLALLLALPFVLMGWPTDLGGSALLGSE